MTIVLVVLAVVLLAIALGFLASALNPAPPPPERLVCRLWAARSITRAKR